MRNRPQQAGFTITEILVVVAMIGGVFLAIVTLQTNALKSQNSALNSMEVTDLKYEISGLLSHEKKCSQLLAGKTSDAQEFVFSTAIKAGALYGKLRISSVKFSDIRDLGNDKRAANIEVQGTKIGGSPANAPFNEKLPVYYTVNSGNVITTCRDNASVCTGMGGVWKVDHCDFCANLGGILQADNTCAMRP
jgi:hypothetical protein